MRSGEAPPPHTHISLCIEQAVVVVVVVQCASPGHHARAVQHRVHIATSGGDATGTLGRALPTPIATAAAAFRRSKREVHVLGLARHLLCAREGVRTRATHLSLSC